ncbi:unnamed protein product [Haemonchus placei]|uniref:VWFA domain-containing protein n=1 Tax=Haemonchus placei TaxID=6290 RepID=A0A0N4WQN6_HAEPC|nr:unnamed protein product [Haemonchus placei]
MKQKFRVSYKLLTTPTTPTTTRPPEPKINPGCECNLKTVWLDVFLLMDASIMMGQNGISSVAFAKLTVGQAEEFQTRLGVIRYASSVELVADLNNYTSTEDLDDLEISTLNETGFNLDG